MGQRRRVCLQCVQWLQAGVQGQQGWKGERGGGFIFQVDTQLNIEKNLDMEKGKPGEAGGTREMNAERGPLTIPGRKRPRESDSQEEEQEMLEQDIAMSLSREEQE